MGVGYDDVKYVNGTYFCKCLPLDCDAIVRIINANSTQEPLLTESKAYGKGDVKHSIEDRRSIASIMELKDDFPQNSHKKSLGHGIEEITKNSVEFIPPSFLESLYAPKDEEVDYPVITTDLVAET